MSVLRLPAELAAWAELAAALVNTGPRETDPAEKLVGRAELERLLAECPEPPPPVRGGDLAAMRALRPGLRRAFEAGSLPELAAALNPLLARAATGWQLAPGGDGWALGPTGRAPLADWFGARAARGLAELAIAYGTERLHMCQADDCLRAVVDVSGNGTRRYCSRTCANRTNARRHRARR